MKVVRRGACALVRRYEAFTAAQRRRDPAQLAALDRLGQLKARCVVLRTGCFAVH